MLSANLTHSSPSYKLVLLGETHVGKSCLITRFARGQFPLQQQSTIGAAFMASSITLEDNTKIKFEIWDTAGSERYHSLAPMYYRNARAAVVVYDLTSYQSFERAKIWVEELREQAFKDIIIVLAGNKLDLCEKYLDENGNPVDDPSNSLSQRAVDNSEALAYCADNSLIFQECSAKSGENVQEIFYQIGKSIPKSNDPFTQNAAYNRANTVRLSGDSSTIRNAHGDNRNESSCFCKN